MLSKNEWDPLKKVIVGIADDAKIPELDISLRTINYADKKQESEIPKPGIYPQQVIDEANEDLNHFCRALQQEGVEVLRPDKNCVPNYYNYCPRDNVLVYDDPVNLMQYVTYVLMKVFGYSEQKAKFLMLQVHQQGRSIVWSGEREKAEFFTQQLQSHQLKSSLEKAE